MLFTGIFGVRLLALPLCPLLIGFLMSAVCPANARHGTFRAISIGAIRVSISIFFAVLRCLRFSMLWALSYWLWGFLVRSASLFTSCVFFFCALFFAGVPLPVRAASPDPSGVYCHVEAGVLSCDDGSVGDGEVCITSPDGQRTCLSDPGGQPGAGGGTYLGNGLGTVHDFPASAPGTGWLSRLSHWFAYAFYSVLRAIFSFFHDLVIFVIACVLALVVAAISAIGVPDFLANFSLGNVLGQAGPIVGFFLVKLRVTEALGYIASGYVFRLTRKFFTLFQW